MFEVADSLPCADFEFLKPLKLSPQYAAIRKRVAYPKPVDAWQVNSINYFIFQLKPAADAPAIRPYRDDGRLCKPNARLASTYRLGNQPTALFGVISSDQYRAMGGPGRQIKMTLKRT